MPDQYQALHDDPSLVTGATEEILRLAVPCGSWIPRYAREDIPFRGSLIRAGDLVVFALQSANRDPNRFAGSNLFDTKVRLISRRAFGFKHPDALITLAKLALGGHRPALPDR